MRTVVVRRDRLRSLDALTLPGGAEIGSDDIVSLLDEAGVPDGFPFVVDDDGNPEAFWALNFYLLAAHAQRALRLDHMRNSRVYSLAKLHRFVQQRRAQAGAAAEGIPVDAWIEQHGEPALDLLDITGRDLIAYRDARQQTIAPQTMRTELGYVSSFFEYANEAGWIAIDPTPRWRGRNTLVPRQHEIREPHFLTAAQSANFLALGLRGDGSVGSSVPAQGQRDHALGLTLLTTGLRRREGIFLLDVEIPTSARLPPGGVFTFKREGKGGFVRDIYITAELIAVIDLYRATERATTVIRYQPTLRRLRRTGRLLVVDDTRLVRGEPQVCVDGHWRPTVRLTDDERAWAVRIVDDGSIEPLGVFLGRGLPLSLKYVNELFADARDRVFEAGGPHQPPAHITVSPHTLRHTFAVRMLAGLMKEHKPRKNDPYVLLANPTLVIRKLLGHAHVSTTHLYLHAAEHWAEEIPTALRRTAAELIADTLGVRSDEAGS